MEEEVRGKESEMRKVGTRAQMQERGRESVGKMEEETDKEMNFRF